MVVFVLCSQRRFIFISLGEEASGSCAWMDGLNRRGGTQSEDVNKTIGKVQFPKEGRRKERLMNADAKGTDKGILSLFSPLANPFIRVQFQKLIAKAARDGEISPALVIFSLLLKVLGRQKEREVLLHVKCIPRSDVPNATSIITDAYYRKEKNFDLQKKPKVYCKLSGSFYLQMNIIFNPMKFRNDSCMLLKESGSAHSLKKTYQYQVAQKGDVYDRKAELSAKET
ncbi:hypothetical protein HNY73_002815 [Argiope bruennichi]|uniref:Uncharacterized protein n=1 Tax=Argiope bruennichi TaxID=94029 RepID=A0A8T0FZ46_ARGBR|nr:hypothetical protein HNY73_002815 [Argiope bruennichi]